MDDSLKDNIEYIFDYQTKLSYDLPLNTAQLFEIDLSSSILNNGSPAQAINNVQDALAKGFRKLYVNITWDSQINNWRLCYTQKQQTNEERNSLKNCYDSQNILNLIKSIRRWIDNSNDCNVVILIFHINAYENTEKEKTVTCNKSDLVEKLEILKQDVMSEVKDILYTVDMMKKEDHKKKNEEKLESSSYYANSNWTSFKKLCSMNKKLLIGLEPNEFLCQQYKDNILFTDNQIIKKLVNYQDIKKYILFSVPKISRNNRIEKVIKLVNKRNNDTNTSFDNQDIDNNNISIVFNSDDIINMKKEVIDLIKDNNMSVHLKTFDLSSIQDLKNSLLWSWDINTNFMEDSSNSCIIINRTTGRWNYHSCEENYPFACKNINNPLMWTIKFDGNQCDNEYTLSLPHSSVENGILLKTINFNKTITSYNYFYLSKTPMEINDDIKSDKRESITMNNHYTEKHLIVPTDLEYSELIEEIFKTSLRPALFIVFIVIFIVIKSIYKQYSTFKKRRRRMEVKKRLKHI